MKYISFSFDDSRVDTYTVAYPIMCEFGIKGTVNVISNFVINPEKWEGFPSARNPMTVEQLLLWQEKGNEIACHGSSHMNTREDVLNNCRELETLGLKTGVIGFASPNSEVHMGNLDSTGIGSLLDEGIIAYIRSGEQVRRNGIVYMVMCVLERLFHSKRLFWYLNKNNIFTCDKRIIKAIAIKSYTKPKQINYLIEKMQNEENAVFMFHSILNKQMPGYGKDFYYWDSEYFARLCNDLVNRDDVKILTTLEQIERVRKNGE